MGKKIGRSLAGVAWLCDVLTWQVWLVVGLGVNANQAHKWAHRTPAENSPFISLLQRVHLIQTPRHHARHHADPKIAITAGSTVLKVSRICLGCMTYGSKKWREWVLEEQESRPLIRQSIEAGINFFDTADVYSLGASEGPSSAGLVTPEAWSYCSNYWCFKIATS